MLGMRRRKMVTVGAALAMVTIAIAGCGGGSSAVVRQEDPTETAVSGGGASLSSVAPNTFLTYGGKRYRLVDLQQASLVDQSNFRRIGTASAADIDQQDLTVFTRDTDGNAIYTYAPARTASDAAAGVEGTEATAPALWYRWVAE
jgi:hypothetical protein